VTSSFFWRGPDFFSHIFPPLVPLSPVDVGPTLIGDDPPSRSLLTFGILSSGGVWIWRLGPQCCVQGVCFFCWSSAWPSPSLSPFDSIVMIYVGEFGL